MSAIQAGARPLPDHVAPVLGSMYFGGNALFGLLLPDAPRLPKISRWVIPYSFTFSRISART
ncbi:hypothetical protein PUN4_700093 [Paraburkholderia unamae]|nr:hypothetical protein PUN4_700093 [Paraburkholderia unamae]